MHAFVHGLGRRGGMTPLRAGLSHPMRKPYIFLCLSAIKLSILGNSFYRQSQSVRSRRDLRRTPPLRIFARSSRRRGQDRGRVFARSSLKCCHVCNIHAAVLQVAHQNLLARKLAQPPQPPMSNTALLGVLENGCDHMAGQQGVLAGIEAHGIGVARFYLLKGRAVGSCRQHQHIRALISRLRVVRPASALAKEPVTTFTTHEFRGRATRTPSVNPPAASAWRGNPRP